MQIILVVLTYLALAFAEPVEPRSAGPRFSAHPRLSARASRAAGRTSADWWATNFPGEDLFVLLSRPKRNAKPKPLLIPLKMLQSIKNNEKRHIDDSSDVANEPVSLTLDLSRLESSVQSTGLNSKHDQKKENFKENPYPSSLVPRVGLPTKVASDDPVKINTEEFLANIGNTNLSECQSTHQKSEEETLGQTHHEIKRNSRSEAETLVENFEQVVSSSVSAGQPDEVEARNFPVEQEQELRDTGITTASSKDGAFFDTVNKELSDSMISVSNDTSTNAINAPQGAYANEDQSVLRKLLQESMLTHLNGNKPLNPEPVLARESFTEISPNSSSAVLNQLADIKKLLQTHATEKKDVFFSNLDYKYNHFIEKTTGALALLEMKSKADAENTKEKIALILDNLSTLKMMIFGQEQRILINDDRIDQFQELLSEGNSCAQNVSSSDTQDKQQVIVNITSHDDSFSGISLLDFNLTNLMEKAPQIVNNTFEDIYEQIGKLEKNIASYDSKLDRYFLKRVDAPEKPAIVLSETNSLCQCNESKFQIEIDALKKSVTSLSSSVDALNVSDQPGQVNLRIDDESEKNTLLDNAESDMAIAESSINNFTQEAATDDEMASRVGLLETKLALIEAELTNIQDLREEVALLKQRLEHIQLNNGSSEGLCVWPYKAHGGQCYHVSTDERLNWGAARTRCRELQGDLAAPRDYEAFKKFIQTQRLSRSYSFWIGASDNKEAGRWVWVSGQPVPGEVWATGHPNLLRSDRCMEIRPDLRLAAAGEACRVSNYFVCQQKGT